MAFLADFYKRSLPSFLFCRVSLDSYVRCLFTQQRLPEHLYSMLLTRNTAGQGWAPNTAGPPATSHRTQVRLQGAPWRPFTRHPVRRKYPLLHPPQQPHNPPRNPPCPPLSVEAKPPSVCPGAGRVGTGWWFGTAGLGICASALVTRRVAGRAEQTRQTTSISGGALSALRTYHQV